LLLTPLLVAAFVCGTIGSFLLWQFAVARGVPRRFDLHLFHGPNRHIGKAAVAFSLGVLVLLLPVSLLVQFAG
jgi:hypothetical protein